MNAKAPGAKCDECPLQMKPCAFTQGKKDSEVILVSRSPGYHEAMSGKPFTGPSGKVLDHLLKQNGVKREDIRVTNVVLCAPDEGKVPPLAIKACKPRLDKELESAKLVIAAGSEAVRELIGAGSIDSYRGYRLKRRHFEVIAANNPALVLRDDSTFPNLVRDFKRAFNPIPLPQLPTVTLLREEKEVGDFLASLSGSNDTSGTIAVDIETRGGLSQFAKLVSIQFSISGTKAVVLGEPGATSESALKCLRTLLEDRKRRFVFHNGKYDVKVLRASYGINARLDEDSLLLSYTLDERSGGDDMIGVHGLEYLLMEEFGWPKYEPENVRKFKKDGIVRDWDELALYAGYDVAGTMQLYNLYHPQVEQDSDLNRAYYEKLIPGAEVTMGMELHGMIYDVDRAADMLENEVNPELSALTKEMRDLVEKPLLNPSSPTQMAVLFYDEWHIKHVMQQRPDKQRSVDDTARKEIIEGRYTVPDTIDKTLVVKFVETYARYQILKKQAGTYLLGLIAKAERDPENRIYTEFLLHGTNSGRPSARNPNLLNITRTGRHADLPDIRALFKASPGRQFVQFDYKQAELRVITAMSKDPELTRIYEQNLDLHNIAAERFYGRDYTNENRQSAKNMNFGVAYRQTPDTFQEKHGIPKEEAAKFVKWWWEQFATVAEWERTIETDIRSKGVLISPFGRKRRFYLLTKENLQASYREGINFYPQSIAADLTLATCIELSKCIDRERAALCLTVYDSILADVEEDYIDEYITITKQIMESRAMEELGWTLPFLADSGVGHTWADAK